MTSLFLAGGWYIKIAVAVAVGLSVFGVIALVLAIRLSKLTLPKITQFKYNLPRIYSAGVVLSLAPLLLLLANSVNTRMYLYAQGGTMYTENQQAQINFLIYHTIAVTDGYLMGWCLGVIPMILFVLSFVIIWRARKRL